LPGVKELFEQEIVTGTKKSRAEMMREIDPEYYGYLDDEDYLLLPQEEKCEMAARKEKIAQFKAALSEKNSNSEIVDMEPETKEDEPSKGDFIDVSIFKTFENYILNIFYKIHIFLVKVGRRRKSLL
jgi:hypothetical protein